MSAEYSVEEVRAVVASFARVFNESVSSMLNAYAERIEADESAVPVGEVRTEGCMHFAYIPMSIPNGTKIFTHPPAQVAQVSKCCVHAGTYACKCNTFQPTAEPVAQGDAEELADEFDQIRGHLAHHLTGDEWVTMEHVSRELRIATKASSPDAAAPSEPKGGEVGL